MVAVVLMCALLLGSTPFGVSQASDGPDPLVFAPVYIVIFLAFILVCIAKGKLIMGLVGIFLPIVALIGAIRIARPQSMWARRRYGTRPAKMAKSEARNVRHEARMDRIRDLLGGRTGATDDAG